MMTNYPVEFAPNPQTNREFLKHLQGIVRGCHKSLATTERNTHEWQMAYEHCQLTKVFIGRFLTEVKWGCRDSLVREWQDQLRWEMRLGIGHAYRAAPYRWAISGLVRLIKNGN